MPIRVAYLINHYPKISHTFIRREILALEEHGVEVTRISVRGGDESELVDPVDKQELRKTTYILPAGIVDVLAACGRAVSSRPLSFGRSLLMAARLGRRSQTGIPVHIAYFVEACILNRKLARLGISHLHAHFGTNSAMVAMLCERLGGVTYSLTIHGSEEFDRPEALALGEKVRHAEFVATISSFCRSQVYRWASPEDWAKIHIVRCGLHPDYFSTNVAPIPATPKLVSVGRLSKEKAQVLMVRAVHLLAQRGVKVELVFAGDGPVRPEIEDMARRCGIEESIRITGWVDSQEVRSHLIDARALILASFAEGVPIVIMESFALGRPVISSFVGGVPELVEDKVSGWLVPPGDVEKLADAMQQAVSATPEQLARMGEQGRKHTLEHHDVTKEAEKLRQLFAELFRTSAGSET